MRPIPCVDCLDLDVEAGFAAGWGFAAGSGLELCIWLGIYRGV